MDEHRAVFAEIVDIARHERVDAVLVTGDVFHERRPALEAQELVAETLALLAKEEIPSVVIPGNHDDPFLLSTLKPLGALVQAYIISEFSGNIDELIVSVRSKYTDEEALIGCLPYLHPHEVLSSAESTKADETERMSRYQDKLRGYFRALQAAIRQINRQAIPMMLAHLHISSCKFGGGEWKSSVFPVDARVFPDQIQYLALGHMHEPQVVKDSKIQAYYAGSILQMDFGERGQQKSVYLIETHPGKPAEISPIELTQGRSLLRRTGTAEEILSQAEEFTNAWVEVVLKPEGQTSELIEQIRALPGVVSLRFEETQVRDSVGETAHNPKERPAAELFTDYYKSKRGTEPEPQLVALFERLYQEVSTARDEPV